MQIQIYLRLNGKDTSDLCFRHAVVRALTGEDIAMELYTEYLYDGCEDCLDAEIAKDREARRCPGCRLVRVPIKDTLCPTCLQQDSGREAHWCPGCRVAEVATKDALCPRCYRHYREQYPLKPSDLFARFQKGELNETRKP